MRSGLRGSLDVTRRRTRPRRLAHELRVLGGVGAGRQSGHEESRLACMHGHRGTEAIDESRGTELAQTHHVGHAAERTRQDRRAGRRGPRHVGRRMADTARIGKLRRGSSRCSRNLSNAATLNTCRAWVTMG